MSSFPVASIAATGRLMTFTVPKPSDASTPISDARNTVPASMTVVPAAMSPPAGRTLPPGGTGIRTEISSLGVRPAHPTLALVGVLERHDGVRPVGEWRSRHDPNGRALPHALRGNVARGYGADDVQRHRRGRGGRLRCRLLGARTRPSPSCPRAARRTCRRCPRSAPVRARPISRNSSVPSCEKKPRMRSRASSTEIMSAW